MITFVIKVYFIDYNSFYEFGPSENFKYFNIKIDTLIKWDLLMLYNLFMTLLFLKIANVIENSYKNSENPSLLLKFLYCIQLVPPTVLFCEQHIFCMVNYLLLSTVIYNFDIIDKVKLEYNEIKETTYRIKDHEGVMFFLLFIPISLAFIFFIFDRVDFFNVGTFKIGEYDSNFSWLLIMMLNIKISFMSDDMMDFFNFHIYDTRKSSYVLVIAKTISEFFTMIIAFMQIDLFLVSIFIKFLVHFINNNVLDHFYKEEPKGQHHVFQIPFDTNILISCLTFCFANLMMNEFNNRNMFLSNAFDVGYDNDAIFIIYPVDNIKKWSVIIFSSILYSIYFFYTCRYLGEIRSTHTNILSYFKFNIVIYHIIWLLLFIQPYLFFLIFHFFFTFQFETIFIGITFFVLNYFCDSELKEHHQ